MKNQQRIVHAAVLLSRRLSRSIHQQIASPHGFSAAKLSTSSSSTISESNTAENEPFYGRPREPSLSLHSSATNSSNHRFANSLQDRIAIALYSATTAFADPTRADAVAALGDITAPITLQRIQEKMRQHPTGRQILLEKPLVSKATIPYEKLMADAPDHPSEAVTFGQAYGCFLKSHGFDPDERDDVKYIQDEDLAYIMKRYRQVRCFLCWLASS
jgi:Coenzyme Q (ubiquinone) biosynthesis protein Coq4